MGAVDPLRGQLYAALVKAVKADQFQQFLEGLMARNPDKKIILYMDKLKTSLFTFGKIIPGLFQKKKRKA